MLTNTQIRSRLQIANACGAKKINTYIEYLKDGKYCPELLAEANTLFGYIDSLKCYKIYDDSAAVDSTTTLAYTNSSNAGGTYWITLGDCILKTGTYDFGSNYFVYYTIVAAFDELGFNYTSSVTNNGRNGTFDIIFPCSYTTSPVQSIGVFFLNSGDGIDLRRSSEITGGVCNYPYEDCITYEQVLNILSAISKICDGNCTDYVTFEL